jgi:hypothetical protein
MLATNEYEKTQLQTLVLLLRLEILVWKFETITILM